MEILNKTRRKKEGVKKKTKFWAGRNRWFAILFWTNTRLHFHERVPTKYSEFHYFEQNERERKREK